MMSSVQSLGKYSKNRTALILRFHNKKVIVFVIRRGKIK